MGIPTDSLRKACYKQSVTKTEIDKLAGVTAGTVTAGKAIVTTTDKRIDALVIADGGLALGTGAGTAITSTAVELNFNDGPTAGVATASKTAVLGANKELNEFHTAALYLGAGAGTALTATAAELNGLLVAGNVSTADLANAAVTYPKTKIKAVVALADAAATLTGAQLADSTLFTITPTVARILTTDTAANIIAAVPGYQVGTWFGFTIVNTAAFDVTLAAGTDVTLVGKMIANNVSVSFVGLITAATTVSIYRM